MKIVDSRLCTSPLLAIIIDALLCNVDLPCPVENVFPQWMILSKIKLPHLLLGKDIMHVNNKGVNIESRKNGREVS